jgi:hypothetical protein
MLYYNYSICHDYYGISLNRYDGDIIDEALLIYDEVEAFKKVAGETALADLSPHTRMRLAVIGDLPRL